MSFIPQLSCLQEKKYFRCEQKSIMRFNNVPAIDISNKYLISLEGKEVEGTLKNWFHVHFSVIESELGNGVNPLHTFMEPFGIVEELNKELKFRLSLKGDLIKILNRKELTNRWFSVKNTIKGNSQFNQLPIREQQNILELGDKDMKNGFPSIETDIGKSPLHSPVFFPIYNQQYLNNENILFKQMEKSSMIFKEEVLPSTFFYFLNKEGDKHILTFKGTLNKAKLDNQSLNNAWVKLFSQISPTLKYYDALIEYKYVFDSSHNLCNLEYKMIENLNGIIELNLNVSYNETNMNL